MTFVLFLHVAAAIFVIGPLTALTSSFPRYLRRGADGMAVLVMIYHSTLIYGTGLLAVVLTGLGMIRHMIRPWLAISIGLMAVAFVLVFAVLVPFQRSSIEKIKNDPAVAIESGAYNTVTGIIAACWVVIAALMVYQPN